MGMDVPTYWVDNGVVELRRLPLGLTVLFKQQMRRRDDKRTGIREIQFRWRQMPFSDSPKFVVRQKIALEDLDKLAFPP